MVPTSTSKPEGIHEAKVATYETLLPEPARIRQLIEKHQFPIEILNDSRRGRYAVASRDVKVGETILRARTYGAGVLQKCRKQACVTCKAYTLARSSMPSSCKTCSSVSYCCLPTSPSTNTVTPTSSEPSSCSQIRQITTHLLFECRAFQDLACVPAPQKKFIAWINSGLSKDVPKQVMEVYERPDFQDVGRWCLDVIVRNIIEWIMEVVGGDTTEPALPLATFKDVQELVPNIAAIPQRELQQLKGLYSGLCRVPSSAPKLKSDAYITQILEKNPDLQTNPVITSILSLFTSPASSPTPSPSQRPPPPGSTFQQLFKWRFPDFDSFAHLLSIRQCNAFGLWDSAGECLGQALYPAASFFNHSCEPNLERYTGLKCIDDVLEEGEAPAVGGGGAIMNSLTTESSSSVSDIAAQLESMNFSEPRQPANPVLHALHQLFLKEPIVRFQASRNILKGEPLCISYIDASMSRELRRKELKETYFFECGCLKCERGE
ncbi:hypothetical protein HDV05_002270 [Chytridiales sp. JEL 0842]|nr:hypothetical protein HDV05_002270 [Chytridiales sp. JEL 0842]